MPSWVQDPKTGKLIPKGEYVSRETDAPTILAAMEPFVSPIDGTIISDRSHLRAHNAKHGVTNIADYGPGYFERKTREREADRQFQTKEHKQERINALVRAYDHHRR